MLPFKDQVKEVRRKKKRNRADDKNHIVREEKQDGGNVKHGYRGNKKQVNIKC